jgi:hypothetical protein
MEIVPDVPTVQTEFQAGTPGAQSQRVLSCVAHSLMLSEGEHIGAK